MGELPPVVSAEHAAERLAAKDREIAALREALQKIAKTNNVDGYEFMALSREAMCRTARAALRLARARPRRGIQMIDKSIAANAAGAANKRFGQWMPEQWLWLFVEEYNKATPPDPAEAMRAALEPFATFGIGVDGEEIRDGLMRDRICDWFGPSDFDAARAALKGNGEGKP